MINRIQEDVLSDSRIETRVKENKQVAWFVQNSEVRGIGRIRNLSTTGMLIETESPIDPKNHHFFSFAADLGHENFVPQRGQLVWARPKHKNSKRFLCGVRFLEPSDYIRPKLEKRIQQKESSEKVMAYINKACDWALFCVIIGLTGYTIWMSADVYQHLKETNARMETVTTQQAKLIGVYKEMYASSQEQLTATSTELVEVKSELAAAQEKIAQLELDLEESRRLHTESGRMIAAITADLEKTRAALTETEMLLANANANKTELEGLSAEAQNEFEAKRAALSNTVDQLEKENEGLKDLMRKLEGQLAYYEGDIKNTEDGEMLIQTYKRNMKLVKTKIRQFRRDAQLVFQKAQSERDKLLSVLGNNGYFVKDGSAVEVDEEKYIAVSSGTYVPEVESAESDTAKAEAKEVKRKVDVNLEFVE